MERIDNPWSDSRQCPAWVHDVSRRLRRCRKKKSSSTPHPDCLQTIVISTWLNPANTRSTQVGIPSFQAITNLSQNCVTCINQSPDGIFSVSWPTWNGVPMDWATSSVEDIILFAWPDGPNNAMRGLKQYYESDISGVDLQNLGTGSIGDFVYAAMFQFRRLFGFPNLSYSDRRLFMLATFRNERQYTQVWDTPDYPGTCYNSLDTLCSTSFIPSVTDQEIYANGTSFRVTDPNFAASQTIVEVDATLPWLIQSSVILHQLLITSGKNGSILDFTFRLRLGFDVFFSGMGSTCIHRYCWRNP